MAVAPDTTPNDTTENAYSSRRVFVLRGIANTVLHRTPLAASSQGYLLSVYNNFQIFQTRVMKNERVCQLLIVTIFLKSTLEYEPNKKIPNKVTKSFAAFMLCDNSTSLEEIKRSNFLFGRCTEFRALASWSPLFFLG